MASSSTGAENYRSYLSEDDVKNVEWRYGSPPNYDVVDKLFEEGRTKIWPPGSLEEKVQNLVKTWEMEMFHKVNFDEYKTVDPNKYRFSLNGRKTLSLEEKRKLGGGYNSLLQTSLPENLRCFNPAEETVDSAHRAFTTAFPRGFALEILQVYSGPPLIVYKFRHWGFMEGPFKGHSPTGEMVEFFGMAIYETFENADVPSQSSQLRAWTFGHLPSFIANTSEQVLGHQPNLVLKQRSIGRIKLDENSKIVKVEFFYDRGELLGGLVKGPITSDADISSSCPVLKNTG